VQTLSPHPDDVDAGQVARRLKSGSQHNHIDLDGIARCGDHRSPGNAVDRIGDEIDIVFLQRPVVLVAQQHALTAEGIIRSQRAAQRLVGHGALQKRCRYLRTGDHHGVVGKSRCVVVLEFPDLPAGTAHR